jgi:hypothetical protein
MKYFYKYTPEIILVVYILLFIGFKDIHRPWDRVINSDGKGYYAYLPAIFIYKDLQFKFVEGYEAHYYPGNRTVFKEFRTPVGDKVVNKYFPGMALIWLPFFLLGHLFAWLEVFPRDGYSLTYQYSIALSALFFLWIGARVLQKLLLRFKASSGISSLLTWIITLGTNLIFFTIVESSMTHVYSFALITGLLLSSYNLFHSYKPKWFVLSLFLLILIILIRPVNLMIIFLIPFLAGNFTLMKESFLRLFKSPSALVFATIISGLLLLIPFFIWKAQVGEWIVYSYGNEKLHLLQPHFFSILFSFNRGWFIYTPIAFISIFGLIGLYRENRFRFFWMIGFLIVFIYITSCWWVWYYASKCGQRVFIDIYAVVALLLLFLIRSVESRMWRKSLIALLCLLIAVNVLQFYQHYKWIFPPATITRSVFLDAATSLDQQARAYLPVEAIKEERTFSNDMEQESTWMNMPTRTELKSHKGRWSSCANKKIPYSVGLETPVSDLFITANRIIRVSAWVLTPKKKTSATLVADFQTGGFSVSYNPFYLEQYIRPDRWTKVECAFYVPRNLPPDATVKVYLFNPSRYLPLYVDDIKVDFLSLLEKPEYLKIDGVIMPN